MLVAHSVAVTVPCISCAHLFRPSSWPYLTSRVGRLLHLPSAKAVSVRPNAHPQM